MIYNKLVRDKIPEIIEEQGKKVNYHILEQEEFIESLKDKLIEETKELKEAKTTSDIVEELADVIDVYAHFLEEIHITMDIVEKAVLKKREKKGSFNKKIFLESVEEE